MQTSSAGGDVGAAPRALRLGGARWVKQHKDVAGDGVKPIRSASSWLRGGCRLQALEQKAVSKM